jgi:hypothetical protein
MILNVLLVAEKGLSLYIHILSLFMDVSIDGVWIGEWIY